MAKEYIINLISTVLVIVPFIVVWMGSGQHERAPKVAGPALQISLKDLLCKGFFKTENFNQDATFFG